MIKTIGRSRQPLSYRSYQPIKRSAGARNLKLHIGISSPTKRSTKRTGERRRKDGSVVKTPVYRTAHEYGKFRLRKSLFYYVIAGNLQKYSRQIYYMRVYLFGRNIVDLTQLVPNVNTPNAYGQHLLKTVKSIFQDITKHKMLPEHLTGLAVIMESHTFFMIEGSEDLLSDFFLLLNERQYMLWEESRICKVESQIGPLYFKTFQVCTALPIYIPDLFPGDILSDPKIMARQHYRILEKVTEFAEAVAVHMFAKFQKNFPQQYALPADSFNMLIVEIQYMELCICADRFYMDIDEISKMFITVPLPQDDDYNFWPIENNYTPADLYQRHPMDINLTFGNFEDIIYDDDEAMEEEMGEEEELGEEEEEVEG